MKIRAALVIPTVLAAENNYSVNDGWMSWGEWSECTVSSDYGTRVRYRTCPTDSECPGRSYEVEECFDDPVYCNDQSSTTESSTISCLDKNAKTEGLDAGSTCTLICTNSYNQVGGETTIVCDYSGDWKGELGDCVKTKDDVPDCAPIEDDPNGVIYCSENWSDGSQCVLNCNQGYHTKQQETKCINSTWSNELEKCEPEPPCAMNEVFKCFNPKCQETCHNSSNIHSNNNNANCDKATEMECTWGCACQDGFVNDGEGCVAKENCQCFLETTEQYYPQEAVIFQNGCAQKCTCGYQQWRCDDFQCPGTEECHIDLQGKEECRTKHECPEGYEWTKWTDVDAAQNGNDRESAKKARKRFPGYGICPDPYHAEGRSRESREDISTLRSQGWFIRSASDRVVCNKRDQTDKATCPDLEARYCCPVASNAECPSSIGEWSSWSNADTNNADGGDYELLITHRQRNPQICQRPSAIDYRHNSSHTSQVLTLDLEYGLVCYNSDQANNECGDYEVRFCCDDMQDLSCLDIKRPFNGRPNPTWLPPDSCCGERPYNSHLKICCKNSRLAELDDGCDSLHY